MKSIRSRINRTLFAGLLGLILASDAVLFQFVRHSLTEQFDGPLLAKAQAFVATSERGDLDEDAGIAARNAGVDPDSGDGWDKLSGDYEFEFVEKPLAEFAPGPEAEYFQVWDDAGNAIAQSLSLVESGTALSVPEGVGTAAWNLRLPDGRTGRAVSLRFAPVAEHAAPAALNQGDPQPEMLVLVMARSREALDQTLAVLLAGLAMAGLMLLGGASILVRWSATTGLKPVRLLSEAVAGMEAGTMSRRFVPEQSPLELRPIAVGLNTLLGRLETAFLRERTFTSNVAHELRTPVAELRAILEVGLRADPGAAREEELAAGVRDALEVTLQLGRLVSTLLALSRGEAGALAAAREAIDVPGLIARQWALHEKAAQAKSLACSQAIAENVTVYSDRALLSAIIGNLTHNMVAHAPDGGKAAVTLDCLAGYAVMAFQNTNSSLVAEDLPHLFEPFWRKDTARSGGVHSGIGLSVVKVFADLLGGAVEAELPAENVFRVTLKIPLPA
ncbi:MAG: hypothetical protein HYV27_15915 [Candidatus Hydrogenedentes bacterium]|nr:hypothetical protein [Candidatus Hydrogenedentota bacterium]